MYQFDFGIDHLVISMCKVISCVVQKGYLLCLVHSLDRIQEPLDEGDREEWTSQLKTKYLRN